MENFSEKLIIRRANLSDFEELIRLSDLFSRSEYDLHDGRIDLEWATDERGKTYIKEHIEGEDKVTFVAEIDGKLGGYLTGDLSEGLAYRLPSINAVLDNIFIDENYRSRGIGQLFIGEFIQWCKSKKVQYMSVTPFFYNQKGINFYKKMGFKESDLVMEIKLESDPE